LADDYRRYVSAARTWEGCEIVPFDVFKNAENLKPDFFKTLMNDVEASERKQAETAEADRIGAEMEKRFNEDFNRKYGLDREMV